MADVALEARRPAVERAGGLWVAPPLIVLAALFFYPLALIARQAFGGDEHILELARFAEVISSRLFRDGLYHTVVIALSATAGCLALGFTLSLIIAFVPSRARSFSAG